MATRAKSKSAKKKPAKKLKGSVATLAASGTRRKRPGMGHNSGEHGVPDEVVLRHIRALDGKRRAMDKVQEELDQARGVYRSARKLAKNDGLNLSAYDMVVKLEKQDQGAVLVDHADAGRYLKLIESPLALQMELFQNLEAPAPQVDVALQGLNAGKGGEPATANPHTPGSEDFILWEKNHKIGVEQAVEGFRG